ncbi:MAG: S-layer homology domain-containing protein [Armatimonadetes bacterium]|nr:S-layer homology domain-containing protein [Armatimonadota bacterium]
MARRLRLAVVLAVALSRAATAGVFADVPWCGWFYNAVEKMASLEAVQGYADGTFRGPQPLSRDEFALAIMQFRPAATSAMWAALGGYPTAIARVTERQETERLHILALLARHDADLVQLTGRLPFVDARMTGKVNGEATGFTTACGALNDLAARHESDMAALTAGIDRLAGAAAALRPRTKALEEDVAALWKLFGRQAEAAKAVADTLAGGKAAVADLGDGVR